MEFKSPRRSLSQNDLFWQLLTIVSGHEWKGQRYSPDDWKDYFLNALRKGRWMPDEDGGFVPIGLRSSDLSKDEMSDLIELIQAFAARHGIDVSEPGTGSQPRSGEDRTEA